MQMSVKDSLRVIHLMSSLERPDVSFICHCLWVSVRINITRKCPNPNQDSGSRYKSKHSTPQQRSVSAGRWIRLFDDGCLGTSDCAASARMIYAHLPWLLSHRWNSEGEGETTNTEGLERGAGKRGWKRGRRPKGRGLGEGARKAN